MDILTQAYELLCDGEKETALEKFREYLINNGSKDVKVFTRDEWCFVMDFLREFDFNPRILFDFRYLESGSLYEEDFFIFKMESVVSTPDIISWANGVRPYMFFEKFCLPRGEEKEDTVVLSVDYGRIFIHNNYKNGIGNDVYRTIHIRNGSEDMLMAQFKTKNSVSF